MNPRATIRLQLHKEFAFGDVARHAGYFARLGVSHVYSSPILQARPGSMHGYDVTDHGQVNAELGGEDALRAMVRELRRHDLGLIVDIVPNHMAAGGVHNARWLDVLEKGKASPNATFFDIDWEPPISALRNKILVPFLGGPYGEVLASGAITLQFDRTNGRIAAAYGDHTFPIRREDYAELLGASNDLRLEGFVQRFAATAQDQDGHDAARRDLSAAVARDGSLAAAIERGLAMLAPPEPGPHDALHALLERQHFRLAWWRTAGDEINWRRFFDVNELIALQTERPEVFDAVHAVTLRLYAEGLIDGLRVDHIDGLTDPLAYCHRLRTSLRELQSRRPADAPGGHAYLIVEKILASGEMLSPAWRVDGTTGYDFMNEVAALLHDAEGAKPLQQLWQDVSGRSADFEAEEREARREILERGFSAQLESAAAAFHRVSLSRRDSRDIPLASFRRALTALMTVFPVYRTYATGVGACSNDRPMLERVATAAAGIIGPVDEPALALTLDLLKAQRYDESAEGLAAMRFQQLSAPLAAKAVEDTAFYRYGRLLSRNDVGFDPGRLSSSIADFHAYNMARAEHMPATLLATATHDHKRGEDVRARLAVLSEIPDLWGGAVQEWFSRNATLRPVGLHPADEYQLYQMIVGIWPCEQVSCDSSRLTALADRLVLWQEKALREGKRRSSWMKPDTAYEEKCRDFLRGLFDPERSKDFLASVERFVARIAPAGAMNSLAQTLLRCTAPGVPDLYQGTEWWDLSMVDPDNRRPVDFPARAAALDQQTVPAMLMPTWRSGQVKQAVIAAALAVRRRLPQLFSEGTYKPLVASGRHEDRLVGFVRRHETSVAIVAVCRLWGRDLLDAEHPVPPLQAWEDTKVRIPSDAADLTYTDVCGTEPPGRRSSPLSASQLFAKLPVALLVTV